MLELEAQGVEITIASLNPPSDTFRHERHSQFAAEVIYPPPPPILKAREKLALDWDEEAKQMIERHRADYGKDFKPSVRARNAAFFAAEFKKRQIDLVHVHFANRATHTALFIKQFAKIPFSFTAHAQDFMVDLNNDDLLREMCREAEFVVAVSDWSRKLLAETCPDSAEKIVRIFNGIRLADFPVANVAETRPLRIITVGRLIEFKGFHHLLAACAKLKELGVLFECTIIGEGEWKDRLLGQRAELGLENEVEFAGIRTQEQVKAMLSESDVFVLPCIVDSKGASDILPTVIMEAMAVSLPVVSTWLVGVPEMVEDGETGLLVQPADEDELAGALRKLAEEPELRQKLGQAGQKLASERFERKVTAGQLREKFAAAVPTESSERESVSQTEILYVLDQWPSKDPLLESELEFLSRAAPEMGFVACDAPLKASDLEERRLLFEQMEFLPDAMVLEAVWLQDSAIVQRILKWRQKLGNAVSTERVFLEARRALQLAEILKKRGIDHIHAARSTTAISAWLTFKLGAAKTFSFATGNESSLHPKVADVLEGDAKLVSRVDGTDRLQLALPRVRKLQLGKVKLRLGREMRARREPIYEAWLNELRVV